MELCTSNTWICDTISCIICYFPTGLQNILIGNDLNLVYFTDICIWDSYNRTDDDDGDDDGDDDDDDDDDKVGLLGGLKQVSRFK